MSRVSTAILLTAFLSTALAGCIQADDPTGGTALDDETQVRLEDALAALDAGNLSANIHRLGSFDEPAQEVDAWEDYLVVMQNPKMKILDISNASDPQLVSELQLSGVKDVKWSDDGEYIFVGDDGGLTGPPAHPESTAGFYVVDASDKENPEVVSFKKVDGRRGPHMVFYHQTADGTELVMGANAEISINAFDRESGTLTELARYAPDIVTDWNRDPHVVDVLYQGWAHDMFVMEDPVDNTTLMYVANWDAGLRVVDLTDPAAPKELGKWDEYPEDHAGNLHTVSTDWIGDRRITVGSPEVGFSVVGGTLYAQGKERTGVYVWDTTDPADIELLGFWTHPREDCTYAGRGADQPFATMGEELTSSHNLQFEDGRVYMAHYACGIVVLELDGPHGGTLAEPKLLAFDEDGMKSVWDVLVHKGVTYVGDPAGVFVDHFVIDTMGEDGISGRA